MYKLSDLPNRPVKYLENCKIERTDFVVVPSPAFTVACSSHCENVHYSLVPTHLTAKILMLYSVMYACITAHETDATKRLLEVGIVPRERG